MNTEDLIRRQTNWIKAIFGCLAALVAAVIIFAAILVPKVSKTIDDVEQSLTEINVLIEDAEEALGNINSMDFENLNKAINDLAVVTNFLANIFGGGNSN
ncbi:MAG: hypothetical protein IKH67_04895 [Lachnospiraceae bacterium]|nr:hypothetical protein [Lachnospiraceae bacterium]MBR3004389.1 hypothetical protein [Lachnospiraceae bacterium]